MTSVTDVPFAPWLTRVETLPLTENTVWSSGPLNSTTILMASTLDVATVSTITSDRYKRASMPDVRLVTIAFYLLTFVFGFSGKILFSDFMTPLL